MTADKSEHLVPKLRFPEFEGREAWSPRRLIDVVRSISNGLNLTQTNCSNGFRITRIETIADGTVDISRTGRLTTDYDISSYRLSIGDILMSNINSIAHIGKSVLIDRDYDLYHGMNLLRIEALSEVIYSPFLYYWLNTGTVQESIRSRANKAVNQASINRTELGKTVVLLPLLTEQQKIADCLGTLDDLIAAKERKLEALRQHKQGLIQQLFPQPGETVPRLRFPEFRNPAEWQKVPLSRLLTFQNGYPFSSSAYGEEKQGLRLIRNRDLRSEDRVVYYDGQPLPDFIVSDGDLLVGMDGDFTPCVWHKGTGLLNQRVGRILPRGKHVLRFLGYLLGIHLKAVQEDTARTTVKHLSSRTVEGMIVHVPNPYEQQHIADCLGSLDDLIAAEDRKLEALRQHKQGLMQQLFPSLERGPK